jgi:hypothetical protein
MSEFDPSKPAMVHDELNDSRSADALSTNWIALYCLGRAAAFADLD